VSYILADMPPAVEGATRADEIAAGRRPYLVHIRAEDLIGWQSTLIAGQETLTQVRIRECVTEPGEYDGVEITQIRVLTPGAWQVWRKPDPTKGRVGAL
jgi:hypothetical protein